MKFCDSKFIFSAYVCICNCLFNDSLILDDNDCKLITQISSQFCGLVHNTIKFIVLLEIRCFLYFDVW